MKVVTAAQMREIDEQTIHDRAIPADILMLEAGRAVAAEVRRRFAPHRVSIICGKGNNAGDGFVVAHELSCDGAEVDILCLEPAAGYVGAAANALKRLAGTHVRVWEFKVTGAKEVLAQGDVVVDALLGTGIRGPLEGPYAGAVQAINESQRPVVCIDVPSGLGDFAAEADAPIVRGTVTVTIGLPKLSLFGARGLENTGDLVVAPIQFPPELLESDTLQLNWAPENDLREWLPARSVDSNKGSFGNVGVIAGSAQFAGAAILVARAALRAGCGLVTVFCPAELNAIYKIALPEATTWIVPSKDGKSLDLSSVDRIVEKTDKLSVLAIGPGIGTDNSQRDLLRRVLREVSKPMVLDADAITLLAADNELHKLLKNRPGCILTPHPGEMGWLLGCSTGEVQRDRVAAMDEAVNRLGVAVLLKGASTLVGRPDGQKWIVRGGTSTLAKGGSGDVLTGVIASLVAQGMPCWQAAVLGATAHVHAGLECARKHGERGVLAGEVADQVPRVLQTLSKESVTR